MDKLKNLYESTPEWGKDTIALYAGAVLVMAALREIQIFILGW